MPPGVHGRGDVPELERQASLFFSPTPMIKSKIRRSEQLCRSSSTVRTIHFHLQISPSAGQKLENGSVCAGRCARRAHGRASQCFCTSRPETTSLPLWRAFAARDVQKYPACHSNKVCALVVMHQRADNVVHDAENRCPLSAGMIVWPGGCP